MAATIVSSTPVEQEPRLRTISTEVPQQRHAALAEPRAEPTAEPEGEESEFRSFAGAILLGIVLGMPIFAALIAALTYLASPDTEPMAIAAIAVWVSLFCGPFLAGTVTVGLWSSRQHA